ncbi:hypothetical protein COV15_00575 [Candidatus Woesearchaeota archaeon CG10_big_fil_rev_8_21_14_0_10_34_12]|nr:MAG: hypothetical protein COV15_00575 [Candidatus Woesearchaeota archaeon CG10_big_fil_rev_8_21_14_0_10_34_12]
MPQLIQFIKEARKKGYDDIQIKELLMNHSWPVDEIEEAFSKIKPKYKFENKVSIFLDSDLLRIIGKRARKNLFTIPEQIEDILRRSCIRTKNAATPEKLDDMLVSIFSRKKKKLKKR